MIDTSKSVEERVATGAAWLDATIPGWEQKVDLSKLDLRYTCRCILGQVVHSPNVECVFDGDGMCMTGSHYEDSGEWFPDMTHTAGFALVTGWIETLGYEASVQWTQDHGFYDWDINYAPLDEAWISLIKERFSTGNLSG